MNIDVSKENIQPLRGGRNLAQLGTALQAQSDEEAQRQLHMQKEQHEAAIRNYQGPDPLDPWFSYIQWVEQSYPKHGHEGQMDKLIKDCLQLFEKDERYYQDRRLVKLWIKYVDSLPNQMEFYQMLYNTGIGVECSEFYRAWACYCEESGDYKRANQVYMLGLNAKAQPIDELEQAHMNFQLFFAQRMLHDDSPTKRKAASALAETRMALTSLKSFKRRNIAVAPVQRIGESVKSHVPGVVRQQMGQYDHRLPNSNVMVNVYEDNPSSSSSHPISVPPSEIPGPASLVQASNLENLKEVGIWTNAKTKMGHTAVVPHKPLPFTPYEDEDDVLRLPSNHMPYCVDDLASFQCALCVPEPPDPSKIPCYNKAQVYCDDTEYSLEEIRSRKYNLQIRIKPEESLEPEKSHNISNINETLAQRSALETLADCALDTEQDHLAQFIPLSVPTIQNITKVTNMHSPGEPKVLVNLDSKEVSEQSGIKKENQQSPALDDENVGTNQVKPKLLDDFNRSLMGNFMNDSVTVNTKEARWELRNLFTDNEQSMVQPVVQQFEMPKFDIHEDRSMTIAINTKKKQEIVDNKPLPEDKENMMIFSTPASVSTQQNVNKTAYFEEPTCTQVFNFNINNASTPNMSQFKKPTSCIDQLNKPQIPKFYIEDSVIDRTEIGGMRKEDSSRQPVMDPHATVENQGAGLSVIMEATREYSSKSGSSSSGQSIRTNFTGYATTPFNEKTQTSNFDSAYSNQVDPNQQASTSKRNSVSQSRVPNGQFPRNYSISQQSDNKEPPSTVPYLSHDHQYQKPVPQNYNGYSPHRPMHNIYQQNYNYPQGFISAQSVAHHPQQQQGYSSPNPHPYHSPQHTGMQSPHPISPVVQPGFQSPTYSQLGYHSPGHAVMSPQHNYAAGRKDYNFASQTESQHVYSNQLHQQQTEVFHSPPHQTQYQLPQFYQMNNQATVPPNQYNNQQNYQTSNQQNQYNNTNAYQNTSLHHSSQNYNQNPYTQPAKQENNVSGFGGLTNQSEQIYQSAQHPQNYFKKVSPLVNTPEPSHEVQVVSEPSSNSSIRSKDSGMNQKGKANTSKSSTPHRSPTSALRNIRHEQANAKIAQNTSDVGFSNQFLNFISNRNEPRDNANTPKFNNSPSISQKMHKNLYVSSPEQAQIPPSSSMSDSDSKDGMTAQTGTPSHTDKIMNNVEKHKDILKRQLDFEHRTELQSEDSRDSISKESRISSVYSRHSDFQSDGYGMDVDSENSMECSNYKSSHSISLIETSDIPRPADINFPSVIDPFNKKMLKCLLEYVKFPNKTHADGYNEVRSVPKLQTGTAVTIGSNKFSVEKQLGKGNYGAVFLCLDLHTNKSVAIKYQKPSRPWEFYICQEIKSRIKDPCMLPGYMDITTCYIGENASLFVSEYSKFGSLLDVANKIKIATTKCINESIVILLTSEILSIVHYLHKAQIIHADIKPDNFLLMRIPTEEWRTPSLQLIDLGCAIDMSLFPKGTTFRELITTEGFTCTEMREGKPWTYQTDLYCLAGTIYVILMGNYMKVANRTGQWNIDKKLPRYMKISLWDKIFTTLLNIPDCNNLPDLMELKNEVDTYLRTVDTLSFHLRTFDNVLKSR